MMQFPIKTRGEDKGFKEIVDANYQHLFTIGDDILDITEEIFRRANAYDDLIKFIREVDEATFEVPVELAIKSRLLRIEYDNKGGTNKG